MSDPSIGRRSQRAAIRLTLRRHRSRSGGLLHAVETLHGKTGGISASRSIAIGLAKRGAQATASSPDEVFVDPRGTLHLMKGLKDDMADFLVVIARKESS